MTSPDFSDSDILNNLPLLTQRADGDELDELPTLTEIVTPLPDEGSSLLHADLPELDIDLPVLTTVATNETGTSARLISEVQLQHLEQQLANHFEDILKNKLSIQLEQLHNLALNQAVAELKAELPELLRNALSEHLESRRS